MEYNFGTMLVITFLLVGVVVAMQFYETKAVKTIAGTVKNFNKHNAFNYHSVLVGQGYVLPITKIIPNRTVIELQTPVGVEKVVLHGFHDFNMGQELSFEKTTIKNLIGDDINVSWVQNNQVAG